MDQAGRKQQPPHSGTGAPGAGLGRSPLHGHCSTVGAVHDMTGQVQSCRGSNTARPGQHSVCFWSSPTLGDHLPFAASPTQPLPILCGFSMTPPYEAAEPTQEGIVPL